MQLLPWLVIALSWRGATCTSHQRVTEFRAEEAEGIPFGQRWAAGTRGRSASHEMPGVLVPSVLNQQNVAPYDNVYQGRTGVLLANGASLDQCARHLLTPPRLHATVRSAERACATSTNLQRCVCPLTLAALGSPARLPSAYTDTITGRTTS